MCFLPLKSSHYPSRPVPVPELFGKYPTRPVPKSKTPTRQTLVLDRNNGWVAKYYFEITSLETQLFSQVRYLESEQGKDSLVILLDFG